MTKKNAEEWLAEPQYAGVTILDPDGWDRKNYHESWAEEITEVEFEERLFKCTVLVDLDSPMHPSNIK